MQRMFEFPALNPLCDLSFMQNTDSNERHIEAPSSTQAGIDPISTCCTGSRDATNPLYKALNKELSVTPVVL